MSRALRPRQVEPSCLRLKHPLRADSYEPARPEADLWGARFAQELLFNIVS